MEIKNLTAEVLEALELSLKMISEFTSEPRPVSFAGLQKAYNDLLSFDERFDGLEISLGISFGQKFVETGRYEWVRVSDEYGEETVVSPKGYRAIVSPISMIQKRIEREETIELQNLLKIIDKSVVEMIESGKYDKR